MRRGQERGDPVLRYAPVRVARRHGHRPARAATARAARAVVGDLDGEVGVVLDVHRSGDALPVKVNRGRSAGAELRAAHRSPHPVHQRIAGDHRRLSNAVIRLQAHLDLGLHAEAFLGGGFQAAFLLPWPTGGS